VITKTDRCIAFPNLYQHQVQPFRLTDPQKPGHRKILVFFLVDPTFRVPSATDVAPQQKEWLTDLTHRSNLGTHFAKLPVELLDLIVEECGEAMTREEAEAYREELMGERSVAVRDSNSSYFEVVSPPPFFSPVARCGLSSLGRVAGIQYVVGDVWNDPFSETPADHHFQRTLNNPVKPHAMEWCRVSIMWWI